LLTVGASSTNFPPYPIARSAARISARGAGLAERIAQRSPFALIELSVFVGVEPREQRGAAEPVRIVGRRRSERHERGHDTQ